jgi:hypothetical protein
VIIFGSVRFLLKKVTKLKKKILKKKPKPGQTDRFWFGSVFYGKNRFKPVWLGFSGFGSVFSVFSSFASGFSGLARFWLGFFWFFVGFGSVRFFRFSVYKTEPAGFFKNLIGLIGFFFQFSRFNRFSGFFAHP